MKSCAHSYRRKISKGLARSWAHEKVRVLGGTRNSGMKVEDAVLTSQKFMEKQFLKGCAELDVIAGTKARAEFGVLGCGRVPQPVSTSARLAQLPGLVIPLHIEVKHVHFSGKRLRLSPKSFEQSR